MWHRSFSYFKALQCIDTNADPSRSAPSSFLPGGVPSRPFNGDRQRYNDGQRSDNICHVVGFVVVQRLQLHRASPSPLRPDEGASPSPTTQVLLHILLLFLQIKPSSSPPARTPAASANLSDRLESRSAPPLQSVIQILL